MPEQAPGEPPSRWTIINDYSKTVVTLCAGLLAFLAAFADKFQVTQAPTWGRVVFGLAIILLLIAIGFALAVPAKMEQYLRICAAGNPNAQPPGDATVNDWEQTRPRAIWKCKFCANMSYIFLFGAALFLALFAAGRLWTATTPTRSSTTGTSCCRDRDNHRANLVDALKVNVESASFIRDAAKAYADAAGIARDAAHIYADASHYQHNSCECPRSEHCDNRCPNSHARCPPKR